jgi:hypothetical protein
MRVNRAVRLVAVSPNPRREYFNGLYGGAYQNLRRLTATAEDMRTLFAHLLLERIQAGVVLERVFVVTMTDPEATSSLVLVLVLSPKVGILSVDVEVLCEAPILVHRLRFC